VSSEATAWDAQRDQEWKKSTNAARLWQVQQPFSSRPALFGAWIENTVLERFSHGEDFLTVALKSNREDLTLTNNLAFSLAQQGKIDDANRILHQSNFAKATSS
jgi:hypothetical protein